jgi:hypothetical protein
VHTNSIKWFKNGHRLADEGHHSKSEDHQKLNSSNMLIEKKVLNEQVFTSLHIRQSTMNDAGVYMCKFGHMHDKIYVDVIINDSGLKYKSSSEVRSNDETQPSQLDFLNSSAKSFAQQNKLIIFFTSAAFFLILIFPTIN